VSFWDGRLRVATPQLRFFAKQMTAISNDRLKLSPSPTFFFTMALNPDVNIYDMNMRGVQLVRELPGKGGTNAINGH